MQPIFDLFYCCRFGIPVFFTNFAAEIPKNDNNSTIMKRLFIYLVAGTLILISCNQKAKTAEAPAAVGQESQETVASNQYTDIELPGIQGQTVKVSDYVGKNKLVLIDFWASWCGPCIRELPYVVKAYERYHDKGLEIVGVSLDKDKASWVQAIEMTGQKWPQMSDLQGWNCKGAQLYGIQSIPANVLINEQGEIIARDLRGEDLINTLAKQLQ